MLNYIDRKVIHGKHKKNEYIDTIPFLLTRVA